MNAAEKTVNSLTEDEAILAVARGTRPGNIIDGPLLTSKEDVDEFMRRIPAEWFAFRRIVRMWLADNGHIPPGRAYKEKADSSEVSVKCPDCAAHLRIVDGSRLRFVRHDF